MRPVLVGSAAAKHWFNSFRTPKDLDYFYDQPMKDIISSDKRVETFYHPDLEGWSWGAVATPDELYTLKVSHMFWNNRWVKHARDVMFFQDQNCNFIPELYDILYPIWVKHYGEKRASLKRGTKAEDFFLPSVDRKYDHDSVHASVAYYDRPLFNEVLQDGEDVAVSWKKFEALPEHKKLQLVREEIYATALERKQIPSNYTTDALGDYRWALQRTCTSFWKGRWALWTVLNLSELVKPDIDYVLKHLDNKERLITL